MGCFSEIENCKSVLVQLEELIEAIETATGETRNCLCFIEVIDTSKELLEWEDLSSQWPPTKSSVNGLYKLETRIKSLLQNLKRFN
jgi:hypothetical protein